MMQKLLIHSQGQSEDGPKIKAFIETRLPYDTSLTHSQQATQDLVTQRAFHLLIFDTKLFSETDLQFLRDLRGLGYAYPTLILADSVQSPEILISIDRFKAHFMQKPFEYKALRGITSKLMLARTVPQQMHRRFRTQQTALVETYISGDVLNTQMYNLSVGGAYFEFGDKSRLAVGDLVRLKVNLNDVSKEHCMNARVVWTTRKGQGGGFGVGVRFIKGNDIYRQLIDKV